MAIPISNYIDISSTILRNTVGDRDFCGLVFTKTAMKETVDAAFADIKTDFVAGKAVALTYNGVVECFGADTDIAIFAGKYFSYNGSGGVPRILNVAKFAEEGEANAYATATAEFTNFGSFTFLDADIENLSTIKPSNAVMIVAVDSGSGYPTTWTDDEYVHCVIGNLEDGVNYAAWMPMAWIASVNYLNDNAAGTINYKKFSGEEATIVDETAKESADAAKMNYIGRVQVYGAKLQFYQKGVQQSGDDLGVIRDKMWLQSEVEAGWFNLAGRSNRIPANSAGAQMVYSMIAGIAMDGVTNGVILADKALSAEKQAEVLQYAGNSTALTAVQTRGFYIDSEIVEDGDQFVCRYLLIYSKGDHISKVVGQHVLV